MIGPRPHYTNSDKMEFMILLGQYRKALESGNGAEIVVASLAIYPVSGRVPRSMRRLVGQTFREATSEA